MREHVGCTCFCLLSLIQYVTKFSIWMINTVEKHHKISKRVFKMKRRVLWKARVWKSALHMVSCMLWQHLTSVLTLRHFQHFNALLRRSTHFLHRRQNGVQCVYKSLLQPFIHLVESRNRAGTRGAHTRHIFASFTEAHWEMTGDPTEGCTARQCTFREGLWSDEMLPFVNHWRFHDHNGSIHRNGGWTATQNWLFFTLSPPDAQYEPLIYAIPQTSRTQIKTRKVHDNRSRSVFIGENKPFYSTIELTSERSVLSFKESHSIHHKVYFTQLFLLPATSLLSDNLH